MTRLTHRSFTTDRGFTLMEVMVAVLILSIGLLGLASLQANGLRNNFVAYTRSQAVVLANDIADRIRANPTEAVAGLYNNVNATVAANDCKAANCSTAQMAAYDIASWFTNLQSLPLGTGSVVGNGTVFTVSVMWDEGRTGAVGAGCGPAPLPTAAPGCFSTTFIP